MNVEAHRCGGLGQRDTIFTDLRGMLAVSGLFAGHENILATQKAGKEREEAQIHGTGMMKHASFW